MTHRTGALRHACRIALATAVTLVTFGISLPSAQAQNREPAIASIPVKSWGRDNSGQLGRGFNPADRLTPGSVTSLDNSPNFFARKLSAGLGHSAFLRFNGDLYMWGNNAYGQVGNGTNTTAYVPVLILTGVSDVACGAWHTVAQKSDGTVWAWGYNPYGALGQGDTTSRNTPTQIIGITGTSIAAGAYHTLILTSSGLYACGNNAYGQLGDGTTTDRLSPVAITGITHPVVIAAGAYHSLAISQDTTSPFAFHTYGWGYNFYGQVGDGTTTDRSSPTLITSLEGIAQRSIAAGVYHSMVLTQAFTIYAWGRNDNGQVGIGTTVLRQLTPTQLSLTNVRSIACGGFHSMANTSGPTGQVLYTWGYNSNGQLGNNTLGTLLSPTSIVTSPTSDFRISAGWYHSLYGIAPPT